MLILIEINLLFLEKLPLECTFNGKKGAFKDTIKRGTFV